VNAPDFVLRERERGVELRPAAGASCDVHAVEEQSMEMDV
jgi:hypothetical protein